MLQFHFDLQTQSQMFGFNFIVTVISYVIIMITNIIMIM